MNMVMNNDGAGGLWQADSLANPHTWDRTAAEAVLLGSIDVLFTNPPFGANIVIDDRHILRQYDLATVWDIQEDGSWEIRMDRNGAPVLQKSQPPEILFIERCLQFLREGTGRMAIVLPNGILNNPALGYVRHWILRNAQVIAVVDMARELFQPKNDTQTSMVLLRRLSASERTRRPRSGSTIRSLWPSPRRSATISAATPFIAGCRRAKICWLNVATRLSMSIRKAASTEPKNALYANVSWTMSCPKRRSRSESGWRNKNEDAHGSERGAGNSRPARCLFSPFGRPSSGASFDRKALKHLRLGSAEGGLDAKVWAPARFKRVYAVAGEKELPYLRPSDTLNYVPRAADMLSARRSKDIDTYRLRKGMILVTCSGRNLGPTVYVDAFMAAFVLSHDMIRVEVEDETLRFYVLGLLGLATRPAIAPQRQKRVGDRPYHGRARRIAGRSDAAGFRRRRHCNAHAPSRATARGCQAWACRAAACV